MRPCVDVGDLPKDLPYTCHGARRSTSAWEKQAIEYKQKLSIPSILTGGLSMFVFWFWKENGMSKHVVLTLFVFFCSCFFVLLGFVVLFMLGSVLLGCFFDVWVYGL